MLPRNFLSRENQCIVIPLEEFIRSSKFIIGLLYTDDYLAAYATKL